MLIMNMAAIIMPIMKLIMIKTLLIPQISEDDNAVLTPLLEALTNIEGFESKFDMKNSALKVKLSSPVNIKKNIQSLSLLHSCLGGNLPPKLLKKSQFNPQIKFYLIIPTQNCPMREK